MMLCIIVGLEFKRTLVFEIIVIELRTFDDEYDLTEVCYKVITS